MGVIIEPNKMEIRDRDEVKESTVVHLTRPISEAGGKDAVYLQDIIKLHPDLSGFIHEHVFCQVSDTENIIMSTFVFEYPKIHQCLIGDAHFEIKCYINQHGRELNLKRHVANLMDRVRGLDSNTEGMVKQ